MISTTEATAIGVAALALLPAAFLVWRRGKAPRTTGVVPAVVTGTGYPKISFGSSEDQPALEISPLADFQQANVKKLDIQRSKIGLLYPALQAAPSLLASAEAASGKYMKVVVNGPLARCKDGNGFRGFFLDSNGKIGGHARLFSPSKLKTLVSAAAVWQLACVLIAQKHIADIQDSLDRLKRDVNEIKEFLEKQRRAVLTGAMDYLDQARRAILQGEFPDAIRHQLEAVERDLVTIQEHLLDDINTLAQATRSLEHKDWFGTEEFYKEIDEHQRKFDDARRQWLLCVNVRTANWLVLSAFPGDDALKSARLSSIIDSLDDVTNDTSPASAVTDWMREKINELHSRLNTVGTLKVRREKLMEQFNGMQTIFAQALMDSRARLNTGEKQLLSHQMPLTLAVRMDGDEIVDAYDLGSANENTRVLAHGAV